MPAAPAALGEFLADVDVLVDAWAGALTIASSEPSADVSMMSDAGLIAVTEALAGLSKRVDALTLRCAAAVTKRSPVEAGNKGLARSHGHSTPAGLIATMKGGRYSEAAKLVAVAEATEPREAFTGERLPARFPQVAAAVADGRLGLDAAAAITSFLTRIAVRASADDIAWSEGLLVERGPVVGVDGLSPLIKRFEAQLDPDGVRPREDEQRGLRSLKIWEDSAGMINLRGRFDPATGAPIKVAIESLVGAELHKARDARPKFGASGDGAGGGGGGGGAAPDAATRDTADAGTGHSADAGTGGSSDAVVNGAGDAAAGIASVAAGNSAPHAMSDASAAGVASGADAAVPGRQGSAMTDPAFAEQRSIAQMNADALADIARVAISEGGSTLPALGFATVIARIDEEALCTGLGYGTIDGIGQPVSASTLRHMAASAGLIPIVFGGEGEVLDFGREKRLFTRAQRLALAERDGGCAHPGCQRPIAHTQAHHICWWKKDKGPTDLSNGILLCAYHHGLLHDGGWRILIRDNRTWFIPPVHIDPEQRPRPGNRSPHLDLKRTSTTEPIAVRAVA